MEIDDEGLPLKEDSTFELKPRLFLEGNLFVNVRPGSPSLSDRRQRLRLPAGADVQHRAARSGPQRRVPGRRPQGAADPPRPVRRRPDRRGRRPVAADAQQGLAGCLQVHLAGQPGPARREPARPLLPDLQPEPRRPRAERQRRGAGRPDHQPADRDRQLRRPGRRPRTGDPGAAEHARGRRHRVLQPQCRLPADPRLRPRGAARRSHRARRRSTRRRRCCASFAASPSRRSCAAWSPTCGRRSPTSPG